MIIFVPHITKLLESKNSDEENNKNCSEKNNKLIEFKHSNSFQLFIYQPKEELYFRYKICKYLFYLFRDFIFLHNFVINAISASSSNIFTNAPITFATFALSG